MCAAEVAAESASAYFHYGSALLRKAQEDSDVLGSHVQQAARQHGTSLIEGAVSPSKVSPAKAGHLAPAQAPAMALSPPNAPGTF